MSNLVVEGGPMKQPPGAGLLSGEAEGGVGVDRGREKVRSTEKKRKKKRKGKRGAEKEVRAEAAHAKRSVFEEGPRRRYRGCARRNGVVTRSPLPEEVRQQGAEEGKEEEKVLVDGQLQQQWQLLQRGVSRGVRRGTQDPEDREEGARPSGRSGAQGNAGLFVDERRHLAPGGVGVAAGAQIARSTFERSFDPMLCDRLDPSREDSRIGRRSGSEVEKYRTSVAGGGVANRAETGGIASGTTSSFNKNRSKRGYQRTERGIQDQVGGLPVPGERSSSWTESGGDGNRKGKEAKGKGKKGKRKEEAKK